MRDSIRAGPIVLRSDVNFHLRQCNDYLNFGSPIYALNPPPSRPPT